MTPPPSRGGLAAALGSRLRNLRISTRLHLINVIAVVGIAAICLYVGVTTRASLMAERRQALAQVMDATTTAIAHYAAQEKQGVLTREQAQHKALAVVHDLRYGEDNYVWINQVLDEKRARRLMNGANDALVGSIADAPADVEFLRLVRTQGGGVVDQRWPRPGSNVPVAKITEVRGVPDWNWVVGSGVYVDDLSAAFWAAMARLTVIFIVVWGLLMVAVRVLTTSIIVPLRHATDVATAIGQGNLDTPFRNCGRNEIGSLLDGMARMQQQLRALMDAQNTMAREHDAGMLSYRVDDTAFAGQFGAMARDTNALVDAHVQTQQQLMDVMAHYAVGDLDHSVPDYPGEKAEITRTMATVKSNLSAINAEIRRLAEAAAAGDFSQRGDAQRFQFGFRAMIDDLNAMIASADTNLEQISHLLKQIASGDLTARMDGDARGVFARMRDDANATVAQLTGIIGRIQQASGSISTAAAEIAAGNDDLSQRSERQAADLEETAASMEELTSTVQQNAEHTRQADRAAQDAGVAVRRTGEAIDGVVQVMTQISEASNRITEIITVIDGIAFQTNILALNAAVEAARAGEQGRGFAVVASEVRTLAQRSATAAKEIASLIHASGERVEAGLEISANAGEAIITLRQAAARTTDLINEISAASTEQASGIEQVNQAVVSMDQTTQQNAALVEEATAAARSLEQQSQSLMEAVAVFKLHHP